MAQKNKKGPSGFTISPTRGIRGYGNYKDIADEKGHMTLSGVMRGVGRDLSDAGSAIFSSKRTDNRPTSGRLVYHNTLKHDAFNQRVVPSEAFANSFATNNGFEQGTDPHRIMSGLIMERLSALADENGNLSINDLSKAFLFNTDNLAKHISGFEFDEPGDQQPTKQNLLPRADAPKYDKVIDNVFASVVESLNTARRGGPDEMDTFQTQEEFDAREGSDDRGKKNTPTVNEGINLNRSRVYELLVANRPQVNEFTGATSNALRLGGALAGGLTETPYGRRSLNELTQNYFVPDGQLQTSVDMYNRGAPKPDGSMPDMREGGGTFMGRSVGAPNYVTEASTVPKNLIGLFGSDRPERGLGPFQSAVEPNMGLIYQSLGEKSPRNIRYLLQSKGNMGVIPSNIKPEDQDKFKGMVKDLRGIQQKEGDWFTANAPVGIRRLLGVPKDKYVSDLTSSVLGLPSQSGADLSILAGSTKNLIKGALTRAPMKAAKSITKQLAMDELPEETGAGSAMVGTDMFEQPKESGYMPTVGPDDPKEGEEYNKKLAEENQKLKDDYVELAEKGEEIGVEAPSGALFRAFRSPKLAPQGRRRRVK